ncbi:hypothetical protein [Chlamydia vaughanii]|uniref:hypothetical protein n=1 Tax=Chlamydia vaughanii TaxID=3112552 RepID=UPI0032B1D44F
MTISSVNLSLDSPNQSAFLEGQRTVHASVSTYSWVAAAITLLAGVLLIALEVGCLVAFALPSSTLLVALVSLVIVASVFLFGMALYQLVTKFIKFVSDDAKFETERIQLASEIKALQTQLNEERSRVVDSKSAFNTEKRLFAEKEAELTAIRKTIAGVQRQWEFVGEGVMDKERLKDVEFTSLLEFNAQISIDREFLELKSEIENFDSAYEECKLTEDQIKILNSLRAEHLSSAKHLFSEIDGLKKRKS